MHPVPAPLVLADEERVAHTAAELIANRLRARPALRLLLSGERTPLGLYAVLRAHARHAELSSRGATVLQLDEYAGLSPDDPRSRATTLAHELRGIDLLALHRLDGAAPDLEAECTRHQALLDEARWTSRSSGSEATATWRSTSRGRASTSPRASCR